MRETRINAVPEDLGAVVVVLHRVLHKTEAVDITHVRVSIGSEKIEATHSLLQREQDTFVSLMSRRDRISKAPPQWRSK